MKHFWKRALTLLLTAGMLLSATVLPSMAEEAPSGETQTEENPYILPADSPYLFMIELLDENDQVLEDQTIYWGSYNLNDDPNVVSSTSRELTGVNKIKLRLSIRKDVELYLGRDKDLGKEFSWPDDPASMFEGHDPWTAGAISEVYTLENGRASDNYFSILYTVDEVARKASFSVALHVKGEFSIDARF